MTVGVVLVSHSAALAEAAAEMVGTLAGGDVTITPAGGTDDRQFGTSIELIRAAVDESDSGDGVVVLMDMGSSVLTAKTMLTEIEDEDDGPDARLADAPLIEGAVAAAVLAATGQELDAVATSAEDAGPMRKL